MQIIEIPIKLKFLTLGICLVVFGCNSRINSAIASNNVKLEDGIYLIHRTGNKSSAILPLSENEKIITFNKEFYEKTDVEEKYIVINSQEFAPILLKNKPTTEKQTDSRKKLLLSLADDAKNKLKQFTTKHINKLTTIVVGGEALTMHKIRMVIDSGLLQVTRCTDNACEMLFFELQDNVVKSEK